MAKNPTPSRSLPTPKGLEYETSDPHPNPQYRFPETSYRQQYERQHPSGFDQGGMAPLRAVDADMAQHAQFLEDNAADHVGIRFTPSGDEVER